MRPQGTLLLLLAAGCQRPLKSGDFQVELVDDGTLTVSHALLGDPLEGLTFQAGTGSAEVDNAAGAFRFTDETLDLTSVERWRIRSRKGIAIVEGEDAAGDLVGVLTIAEETTGILGLEWAPSGTANRLGVRGACDADDHFLGLGAHAMDVDHVGQAFALFVSEPGIDKVETEDPPDDWFLRGTRHASSYPVPWLMRPHHDHGLLLGTAGRVAVDLCATGDTWDAVAWTERTLPVHVVVGAEPVDVVTRMTSLVGRPSLPPPWVFAPWNDAVRGVERLHEVVEALRSSGASSSVIWSEDWRGKDEGIIGYHPGGEWRVDRDLYPDPEDLADWLEDQGFQWFAYFTPFVFEDSSDWEEAYATGALVEGPDGDALRIIGPTQHSTGILDPTTQRGRDFALTRMREALDVGFDGWMADFGEWLPLDAPVAGLSGMDAHNLYPEWWQDLNLEAIDGYDATFFARSGWLRSAALAPVIWAGDQQTSYSPRDGLPSVLAQGIGLAACGVPVFTHDVGGYQSLGETPTDEVLWARWAALGAFSPVLRTHHGAYSEAMWQFDSSRETLERWARWTREHMRLWPYRYGLAARAAADGVPMLLPVAFRHGDDWGRMDAWMLGDALLVAPVLEEGVDGREVELPDDVIWYDWWTGAPATSGWKAADLDGIPVFAAAGTTVPTFDRIPDTLVPGASDALLGLEDVDTSREVFLFGGGGPFDEADGTTYRVRGTPTGSGEVTVTLTSGTAEVGGVTLTIDGPVERTYRVIAVAP